MSRRERGRGVLLAVLARRPVAGRAKTRLIPLLGAEDAARFHEACLRDTVAHLDAFARRSGTAPPTLFLTPARGARTLEAAIPAGWQLAPQGTGGLGTRMARALGTLLAGRRARGAILVGTDSPDLPMRILRSAVQHLRRSDVVLAPAHDGGFTLIGVTGRSLARDPQRLGRALRAVPWSADETLARTIRACRAGGLSVSCLEAWWDVDEPRDIELLRARLELRDALGAAHARHVEQFLLARAARPS